MENATKALLIAGGVLIAIIIISMFIMMFNKMSNMQNQQEEQLKVEQIAAFNAEYESYNKKAMYGTEVMTIMNKAIQNNLDMDASKYEDAYYINIKFKLNDTIQDTVIKENMNTKEQTVFEDFNYIKDMFGHTLTDTKLEKNKFYSLGTYVEDELKMDVAIKKLFSAETNDHIEQSGQYRYYIKSALNQFKTTMFKCTDVVFNEYGRIKEMTFEQR